MKLQEGDDTAEIDRRGLKHDADVVRPNPSRSSGGPKGVYDYENELSPRAWRLITAMICTTILCATILIAVGMWAGHQTDMEKRKMIRDCTEAPVYPACAPYVQVP